MIKVLVKYLNNNIKEIKINGHADFDTLGKDIVCASVSSMMITTINGILSIDKDAINYSQNNELVVITNNDNKYANILLKNLVNLLKELAIDYPKNINIRKWE